MRKLVIATAAILSSCSAVPAAAQVYTDGEPRSANGFLLPNGGSGYNGYNGGYSSGCYGAGAIGQVVCTISQVAQISQQERYRRQQLVQQQVQLQREALDQRARQAEALARACQAGDTRSCQRTGGGDPRTIAIARALMDACAAGDRESCVRADAMMNGRQTARN